MRSETVVNWEVRFNYLLITAVSSHLCTTIDLTSLFTAPYYLVFFKEDRSLGVAKANNIIELDKEDLLEPGTECHVRLKKNVFGGIVVTHGTEIDVDIVAEKIINKLYTPEFLKGLLSDDSDSDDVTTDCTCASDSDIDAKSKRNAKRKRTDSGKPAKKSMMKTPLKKTNRKSKTRSNVHKAKDEQKSTINVLAVSQNTSNTSSAV
uniref:Uncharacterized protein n=1 Tax=Amphimedon queenslandica TaxID=400682 RepID=A0A1X7SG91_AMPQE